MPSYFALATLVDGPLHGYAIVRRAAELSDGAGPPVDRHAVRAARPRDRRGARRRRRALPRRRAPAPRLHPHPDRSRAAPGRGRAARARRSHGHAAVARDRHGGDAMSGERIAELALLAYPAAARAARGDEMLATLQDASAGSRRHFVREIADLVRLGLRARGSQTASAGARRIVADGLCLAAVWFMTLDVSTLLSQRARGMHDPLLSRRRSPSSGRSSRSRWSAMTGSPAPGARVDGAAHSGAVGPPRRDRQPRARGPPRRLLLRELLVPRRRAPDLRRLAWLLVPATLVATAAPPPGEASPLLLAGVLLAALFVVVVAVALLPTDPRLAIAGAVSLSNLGIAVVVINHDSALVPLAVRGRGPDGARRRDHAHTAPAGPRAHLAPRGFTNSEPFPGLWLGRARDAASRSLDHESNPQEEAP